MFDRLVLRLVVLMAGVLVALSASPALCAASQRDVFYTYDALGHQLTAKFNSATGADRITNAYNGFGELISSTISISGVTKTVAGQYDADGNRTQATVDGQAFTYGFDGLDRLNNIYEGAGTSTPLDQFAYNADATLHSRVEGTGSLQPSATYGYDGAGRLISQSDAFPATTQSNVGWTFTRNPASELAGETRTNDSYAYSTLVNANPSYTVNGLNQYTGIGAASFCYDANGNLTADGSSVYLYDVENRLVQKRAQTSTACPTATTGYTGALQANVTYDPLGRLNQVDKGTSATTTLFLYDGDALVAEYNSTGATLLARYVHGTNAAADDPLVWYTYTGGFQTGKRFLHADHLGSIVAMTNGNSAVSLDRYDEYGIPGTDSTGAVTNIGRFQYTGQAYIPELGMYYYKARIYSPRLGRFLQTDPVGYADQVNLYAYVGDDPVDHSDPMGTDCCYGSDGYHSPQLDIEQGARTIYELSGAKDVVTFVQNPSLKTGIWAAMAIAPVGKIEKPLAVIGHFSSGYVRLAEKLSARYFSLSAEQAAKMSDKEIWHANQAWLDRQIEDRATFRLSTPADQAKPGSSFAKELEHLEKAGYKTSKDGMELRPPPREADCTGTRIC